MSSDETERLVKMEEVLHSRVIGQEEAVTAISRAIRRARVGLKNPNRPIASFIFSGARRALALKPAALLQHAAAPQRPSLRPQATCRGADIRLHPPPLHSAGPTGVGKSELAKTLASYYFGSEEAMVRLDMSEFMER